MKSSTDNAAHFDMLCKFKSVLDKKNAKHRRTKKKSKK